MVRHLYQGAAEISKSLKVSPIAEVYDQTGNSDSGKEF